jgi:RNA recognition motif-containing protein
MNIFVAKLSPKSTNETLSALFEEYGKVESAKIIFDRDSGRSKCFGFVEMPNEQEAFEAINDLDGCEFEGSAIVVKKARPKDNNREQGGNRSSNKY